MKMIHSSLPAKFFPSLAATVALLFGGNAAADAGTDGMVEADTAVHHRILIAPYAWAMAVSGTVGINGTSVPLDLQSSELLRGVKSGSMGYIQVPVRDNFIYLESLDVGFGQSNFQSFFNQSIAADMSFVEAGFGWNIPVNAALIGDGKTTVSPYVGIRAIDLRVSVNGPLLFERIKTVWHDPALGVIIQGLVWRNIDYAVKLDAAGFNVDGDNYRSALGILKYAFNPSWSLAVGYRVSKFKAKPSSAKGLTLDLTGSGPLVGLQFSF